MTTCNSGNTKEIDECLHQMIDKINLDDRYKTLLCCCGHSKYETTILVLERSTNHVFEWFTGVEFPRRCKNGKIKKRYYVTDDEGYYFLPDLVARQ